jgi:uncharacterized protein (TIGR02646 family)
MKQVRKGTAPQAFAKWTESTNDDWVPTYNNLQNPEKRSLQEALLTEQGWVCCYCGRSISQQDSHIEHFRPQEFFGHLALTFENLHASCIRETEPGTPLHCGHAKRNEFDEALQISPIDPGCEARFLYTYEGKIMAVDAADQQAAYMVRLLKLDIPFLSSRREEEIRQVFDPQFLASVTAGELSLLRDTFRAHDDAGRAQSFGHVLARFAEQRLLDGAP